MDIIKEEFSRFANSYNKLNVIQKKVAEKVAFELEENIIIVDLGCGAGTLLEFKCFKFYYGVDFSQKMLDLHPKNNNIILKKLDFNKNNTFDYIKNLEFDYLISLSALQWANDLDFIFKNISQLNKNYILAIFTSNTFKTIHKTINIESPIHSLENILKSANKFLKFKYEIVNYKLEFDNSIEMFRYIKNSGVSGNRKILSYKETKNLINNYPLNYLEFEVIFLKG